MVGQKISHYRIDAELGRGGMGVVYRAHDERLRRDVAVKLLSDRFSNRSEQRERILAEARAASALNHPGITTIYEVGEDGEKLFLVMELITGKTLREMAQDRPGDARSVARLGHDVAEALGAAHAHGIVHGDIKPENIVVTSTERVKLLDFGIAKQAAEEAVTQTRSAPNPDQSSSTISGTLAYMSPEQLRGQPLDARADLFGLGVVLYEMAAGHRPFPGPTSTAVMAQILREEPVPLPADTSPGLREIIAKLLQKDPAARYQSAREAQAELKNLIRELETRATLPPAVAGKRAVAVLPFTLLTPNPNDEYLSVALADAVINQLTASGELLVRPTSLVARYTKQTVDPQIAARELNVQVVIQGSIQKVGQRLRVHVQAWNAADGSTLLSAKHDADASEMFELQDKIADSLVKAFGVQEAAGSRTPAAPPTKNVVAYELFLRAGERLSRLNRWDTRTAIEILENAVKLDPRFADAWGRLAQAYFLMGGTYDPGPQWLRKAEKAIRRALVLDPGNADAQCARGQVLWTPARGFKNRLALMSLEQALRLNPGCHPALIWKCLIFLHVGLMQESIEGLTAALATHPEDGFVLTFLAQAHIYQGKYEQAEDYLARALSFDRASFWANLFYPTVSLYCGKLERAEEKIHSARQVMPGDPLLTSWEALLWAKRGESRRAVQMCKRAVTASKSVLHTHHTIHNVASTYATLGNPAQAIAFLRKASSTGLPNYPLFRDDPHFISLRRHPAYLKLLSALKKEWQGYQNDFGNPRGT